MTKRMGSCSFRDLARTSLFLLFAVLLLSLAVLVQMSSAAQQQNVEVGQDGVPIADEWGIASRLMKESQGGLTEKQAVEMATFIEAIAEDKEARNLIQSLKEGSGRESLRQLQSDGSATGQQMVLSMFASYKVMRVVDEIFNADEVEPEQAFLELVKEGLIDEKTLETYRDKPEQLERDTKQAVQFKFIALGAASGYL